MNYNNYHALTLAAREYCRAPGRANLLPELVARIAARYGWEAQA